jgi:hypothetical protein
LVLEMLFQTKLSMTFRFYFYDTNFMPKRFKKYDV